MCAGFRFRSSIPVFWCVKSVKYLPLSRARSHTRSLSRAHSLLLGEKQLKKNIATKSKSFSTPPSTPSRRRRHAQYSVVVLLRNGAPLKPCPHVHRTRVVRPVPETFRVLVHLVGGGRDGQGLFEPVGHPERQLEVLLHVLQRLVGGELALDDCCQLEICGLDLTTSKKTRIKLTISLLQQHLRGHVGQLEHF